MPHPGKLGLSRGRWIVSEQESVSSDAMSSCGASLVSVSSLRSTSVCTYALLQSHSLTHKHEHTLWDYILAAHSNLERNAH